MTAYNVFGVRPCCEPRLICRIELLPGENGIDFTREDCAPPTLAASERCAGVAKLSQEQMRSLCGALSPKLWAMRDAGEKIIPAKKTTLSDEQKRQFSLKNMKTTDVKFMRGTRGRNTRITRANGHTANGIDVIATSVHTHKNAVEETTCDSTGEFPQEQIPQRRGRKDH